MNDDDKVIRDHRRQWRDCLYVYPVVSRRSKGLSIGVNLNRQQTCTFSCVYCQVDRSAAAAPAPVDLATLHRELTMALEDAMTGSLWAEHRFSGVSPMLRRVNDIAFSGDGEPTCLPNFDHAVEVAAAVRTARKADDVKIVLITNATRLDRPHVQRAMLAMDKANGEVWAKLDAGTDDYFHRIDRPFPRIPLQHILDNILLAAKGRPIVIQSLFLRLHGEPTPPAEIDAYCRNLRQVLHAGGQIKLIQAHTIARPPAEKFVLPLIDAELDAIAMQIRRALPEVPVEVFYG